MKTKKLEMVFGGIYRFENDETVILVDFNFPIPEVRILRISGEIDWVLLAEVMEEIVEIRKELMKHYLN